MASLPLVRRRLAARRRYLPLPSARWALGALHSEAVWSICRLPGNNVSRCARACWICAACRG